MRRPRARPEDRAGNECGNWQPAGQRRKVSPPTPLVQPGWKKAVLGLLTLVLFAGLLARSARQLAQAPRLNWDMLPAMALALEWEEPDPVALHRRTYAAAREELSARDFQALVAPGVRQARAQDPAAFHEHLAFYRSRVLYTLAVQGAHRLGVPLTAATWWVSIASWAGCGVLFLVWARRHLPLPLAAAFALGLASLPPLLSLACTSSADGLALLLTCLGAWALVERRSFALGTAFLLLALGARSDAVILLGLAVLAFLAGLPREERPSRRAVALALGLGAALTLGLRRFGGEYGWWPLIQISFVEKAVHPSALPTAVDWSEYLAILARQLALLPGDGYVQPASEVTGSTLVFLWLALAAIGLWLGARERRVRALLAALLAAYLLRFLLFPQIWDRFYAPFYALVPLGLLSLLGAARASAKPQGAPPLESAAG